MIHLRGGPRDGDEVDATPTGACFQCKELVNNQMLVHTYAWDRIMGDDGYASYLSTDVAIDNWDGRRKRSFWQHIAYILGMRD